MLFKDAGKLDLDVGNLDTLIKRPTKSLARTAIHNDKHFINTFIVKYLQVDATLSSTEVI